MQKRYRYAHLLLASLMALGVGGCGGTDSSDSNSSSNGDKTPVTSTSGTIIHRGISYGIVKSKSGRRWLDRNLGAKSVCDGTGGPESCYGDLYQWGRMDDGHENPYGNVIYDRVTDIDNPGDAYIADTPWYDPYFFPLDKKSSKRLEAYGDFRVTTDEHKRYLEQCIASKKYLQARWMKSDGTGICPKGFRVVTQDELSDEVSMEKKEYGEGKFFQGVLKLAKSGLRSPKWGPGYRFAGGFGALHTLYMGYPADNFDMGGSTYFNTDDKSGTDMSDGLPVRCIDASVTPTQEDLGWK